jgi:hypothetical protein
MNTLENFHMQKLQQEGTLIPEQSTGDENPLFRIIIPPRPKEQKRQDSNTQTMNVTATGS